jgi:copper transport protein
VSRGTGAALLLAAVLASGSADRAHAHAVLRVAEPPEGATLDETPAAIRLTFSERPDAALSEIRVVGTTGAAYEVGRAVLALNDPLSVSINLRPLDGGVYTVSWRIVSSVDGHATSGAYAFGVGADPSAAMAAAGTETPAASIFQMVARWMLLTGLVLLAGAAAAAVGRFGGPSDVSIGAVGTLLALVGVVLLAVAQTSNAAVSVSDLLNSSAGRSLAWRLIAIAVAGTMLVAARRHDVDRHRHAMVGVLIASLAAIAIHVAGGHAAAAGAWTSATIASQWVHFSAAAIWFGGLAALLIGIRGAPSAVKADAVRRFSLLASIAVIAVAVTGIARSAGELTSWGDLTSTGYGQAVLAKVALTIGIAAFAAVNHWRSVAAAAADLRPLRRAGAAEVVLAVCALAAAAVLGSLPPPAAELRGAAGLDVSGVDFGTTLRVRVTAATDQAGPNRFLVTVTDYDSGEPIETRRATLRFTSLDDPRMASSALELARRADGAFVGSGSHLAVAGRWRLTALIEREGDSVDVSMDNDVRIRSN